MLPDPSRPKSPITGLEATAWGWLVDLRRNSRTALLSCDDSTYRQRDIGCRLERFGLVCPAPEQSSTSSVNGPPAEVSIARTSLRPRQRRPGHSCDVSQQILGDESWGRMHDAVGAPRIEI